MMCATYTRKLAQKKANALLGKMPSAVVIVDEQLRIIECNSNFVGLFSSEGAQVNDLEGSALDAVIPFAHLFRRVLDSGEDIVGHDIRYQRIFQKEQIIARAREVIQKNLNTVQQIAYLLGENAADSEITLNSIVRSFSPEEIDDRDYGAHDGKH
jgi:PAS domain-containing protein